LREGSADDREDLAWVVRTDHVDDYVGYIERTGGAGHRPYSAAT
jgi:hypothetical protein